MNEKEIAEIRRRFNPQKSNITAVCGCLVNEKNEIVSECRTKPKRCCRCLKGASPAA